MKLQENYSLQHHNTFGIYAKSRYFIEVNHAENLPEIFKLDLFSQVPLLVLGSGSNVLFTKDFDGCVLKMNNQIIYTPIDEGDYILVKADAGVVWTSFVNHCITNGWGGIENLSLIPGTVGASPIQNIGAYGVEIKAVLYECTAFEIASRTFKNFSNADCEFSYRDSVFKNKLKGQYIITSVTYQLRKHPKIDVSYGAIKDVLQQRGINHPTIKDVSEIVSTIRVEKLPDPSTIGSAGSFFKNPIVEKNVFESLICQYPNLVHYPSTLGRVKVAAGWLIEQCGWKGKFDGEVGVWKNQALVLVNRGNATGKDVYQFSEKIIESVDRKFGIRLEREVNVF